MENSAPEGRQNERLGVLLNARCRKTSWMISRVDLADLSEGGCRIVGNAVDVTAGQEVEIRITDVPAIPGTVRWVKDGDAGIEFDSPLDSENLANLTSLYSLRGSNVIPLRNVVDGA